MKPKEKAMTYWNEHFDDTFVCSTPKEVTEKTVDIALEEQAKQIFDDLEKYYNHRKDNEGLVSLQNMIIRDMKKVLNEKWCMI